MTSALVPKVMCCTENPMVSTIAVIDHALHRLSVSSLGPGHVLNSRLVSTLFETLDASLLYDKPCSGSFQKNTEIV